MGVFSPYAFFFLSLLGPVIWFYLWREKKHVILVSSIIPWRQLSLDQTSDARAFRVDWQLILQLLIVILATLALTRLYWLQKVSINYRVLIVDTSASMLAKDVDNGIRMESARAEALKIVNAADAQTRIALVEMAGNANLLHDFTDDKNKLTDLIQKIKPKEEGTDFQAAVNIARSSLTGYVGGKIFMITDNEQWLEDDPEAKEDLNLIKVGQSVDNLAITSIDSYQGLYAGAIRTIYIRVVNYGSKHQKPWLNVYLDDKLIKHVQLEILPGGHQNYPFKLKKNRGVLRAELEVDDALKVDNITYLLLENKEPFNVLLVTANDWMNEDFSRLAAATEIVSYNRVLPEEFDAGGLKDYHMVIFHNSAPTKLLPIDSFFIASPPGHGLWKVAQKPIKDVKLIDWDRQHETLKYLDFLDKLPLGEVQDVNMPSWGNLLMGTPQLPIAFWGEEDGFHQLVFCFDIQPLIFPPSQDISGIILLLNSMDWLASSHSTGSVVKTGEPYLLKLPNTIKEVMVRNPKGEELRFKPDQKIFNFDRTNYVGIYQIQTEDIDGKKSRHTFVANLANESEANLVQKKQVQAEEKKEVTDEIKEHKEPYELWRYLVALGIICLLGEWWLYFLE